MVRQPGPVLAHKVCVRGEVNEAKINDELDDLEPGDPVFPPGADAASTEEVVKVHHDVNTKVQSNGDP